MTTITLEHLHQDMMVIKREIEDIKNLLEEDSELTDEFVARIKKAEKSKFIKVDDFTKHYGAD